MNEIIPIIHLGFSESIEENKNVNNSSTKNLAHKSPYWLNWDGGKIGGKPSWLNPRDIPKKAIFCSTCDLEQTDKTRKKPLYFVCQIYAPLDINENCFHRSLYVFVCSDCDYIFVLRNQLGRYNPFYPTTCDDIMIDNSLYNQHKSIYWNVHLCIVCGQRGTLHDEQRDTWFCCQYHKENYIHSDFFTNTNCCSFIESEIFIEDEPNDESDENNLLALFETDDNNDEFDDDTQVDLEQHDINEMTDQTGISDLVTIEFYTRIGRSKGSVQGQCLRYCRWKDEFISPLWISSAHQPKNRTDIPSCNYCGSERNFEFQLMPQMINYLKFETKLMFERERSIENNEGNSQKEQIMKLLEQKDSIDWGTVAIYTCTSSCGDGFDRNIGGIDDEFSGYRKEFAWRQPPL